MTAGIKRGRIHTFRTRRTVPARMELFLGPFSTVAGAFTSSSLTSTSFPFEPLLVRLMETLLESPGKHADSDGRRQGSGPSRASEDDRRFQMGSPRGAKTGRSCPFAGPKQRVDYRPTLMPK